jgi:hypothetical protein
MPSMSATLVAGFVDSWWIDQASLRDGPTQPPGGATPHSPAFVQFTTH